MRKIKLALTTIVCIATIVVNIISNSYGNEINASISNIELSPNVVQVPDYSLGFNGQCMVFHYDPGSTCNVSLQCCFNQPPYCGN